ncbi:hypothetical protein E2542_SST19167 [Spatholobus suberectus]|nr:hypothetical protein E2542_SST19167 [Spatholobus suberectus]
MGQYTLRNFVLSLQCPKFVNILVKVDASVDHTNATAPTTLSPVTASSTTATSEHVEVALAIQAHFLKSQPITNPQSLGVQGSKAPKETKAFNNTSYIWRIIIHYKLHTHNIISGGAEGDRVGQEEVLEDQEAEEMDEHVAGLAVVQVQDAVGRAGRAGGEALGRGGVDLGRGGRESLGRLAGEDCA